MQQLSNLQIELLKLYANGVSEENLHEIKSMLAKYFAGKASDAKFVDYAITADAVCLVFNDSHFQVLKTIDFPIVNVLNLSDI